MLNFKEQLSAMNKEMHEAFLKNDGKIAIINNRDNLAYKICVWDASAEEGESTEDAHKSVTLVKFIYDEEKGFGYDVGEEIEDYDFDSEVGVIATVEFKEEVDVIDAFFTKKLNHCKAESLRACESFEYAYPVKLVEMPLSVEKISAVYLGDGIASIEKRAIGTLYSKDAKKNREVIYGFDELNAYNVESLCIELMVRDREKNNSH